MGPAAVSISCADNYYPAAVKSGEHAPLTVRIADHSAKTEDGRSTFDWRKLKGEFKTLDEAKAAAVHALEKYPHFVPTKEEPKEG